MKYAPVFYFLLLLVVQCRPKENNFTTEFPGKPGSPSVLKKEHERLLGEIGRLASYPDNTGKAAGSLDTLMQHHFGEEEDFVFPQLAVLPTLASGEMPDQSEELITLGEKLNAQLSHLHAEHQMIKAYMQELKSAAAEDHRAEFEVFENDLDRHAKMEEEVIFPAAILVGDYLKIKKTKNP